MAYTPKLAGKHLCFTVNASLIKSLGGGKTHKDEIAACAELLPILCRIVETPGLEFLAIQLEYVSNYHLQGYMELESATKFSELRTLWGVEGKSCTFAKRVGTPQQAADYCRKAESRVDSQLITPIWFDARPKPQVAWNSAEGLQAFRENALRLAEEDPDERSFRIPV